VDETDYSHAAGVLTLNATSIGAMLRSTTNYYFWGDIDEVAHWNRRLTWTEIQQVMTTGIPTPASSIPPTIVMEPLDRTNNIWGGDSVTFSVQATGTSPLSYQWLSNNISISGDLNPTAQTSTLVLTSVQPSQAAGYSVVITNASGSVTSRVAQLLVNSYVPVAKGEVLKLDFGLTGSPDVQPGFTTWTLPLNGTNFNGVKVTVSPIGGATTSELLERQRTDPWAITNTPSFDQASLYNDFIMIRNPSVAVPGTGMRLLIERLAPSTTYGLTVWSWTTQSTTDMKANWVETSSGSNAIAVPYVWSSSNPPTNNNDRTFGALLISSASGKLQIDGTEVEGFSVVLNGLQLVAQPDIQIVGCQLVGGKIRLTINAQYPGQAVTIQQKANLSDPWVPAVGEGITEQHGAVLVAEFPASASKMFYRATGQ
jgi:hypothetical protein